MLLLFAASLTSDFSPLISDSFAYGKASYLHFVNGLLLERKGDYAAALQEFSNTLTLDPQSTFVYQHALRLAVHLGKTDDAMAWAGQLAKVDPADAENWVLLGGVQWAKGNVDEARKSFEKGLELDNNNAEGLYQMASLLSSSDPEKSIYYLKRYLAVVPDEAAETHYQIALLYDALRNKQEVLKNLELSIKEDASFTQSRYALAQVYETAGDTAAALSSYLEITAEIRRFPCVSARYI